MIANEINLFEVRKNTEQFVLINVITPDHENMGCKTKNQTLITSEYFSEKRKI